MKTTSITLAALMLTQGIANASAVATWSSISNGSATGILPSAVIAATTSDPGSTFWGISTHHLTAPTWQAGYALPMGSEALIALSVNAGDWQQFNFAGEITTLLVYIENFDASSMANVMATGATSMSLLSGSPSISYAATNATSGVLSSSNASPNGEGDAILAITGPISALRLDYTGGTGGNAVLYGFAVPEPASIAVWAVLLSVVGVVAVRRRK